MNKRLLYSAVLAASLSVGAQAQVSEPQLSSPATLKLDGTDTVYIYNVKAQQWLSYGNHWGTQVCVKPIANAIGFIIKPNDDGTYTFFNNSNGGWSRKMFMDTASESKSLAFVDYGSQAAWKTKFVIHNGNQTNFQIQVDTIASDIKDDATLTALGETRFVYDPRIEAEDRTGAATGTGEGWVSPTMPVDSISLAGAGADWQAYTQEDINKYNLRLTLMTVINDAAAKGVDVSAQAAIYNNSAATLVQLQSALYALVLRDATVENPVDVTEYVNNAACESLSGWDVAEYKYDSNGNITSGNHGYGTAWQIQGASYTNDDEGVTISKFIERWVNSAASYNEETDEVTSVDGAGHLSDSKISQTIVGLPAGGYEVSACVIATQQGRQGDGILENSGVNLFINDASTEIYTLNGKPEKKTSIAIVGEDGKLTFGLELKNAICNWVCIDNIEVKYYGNDAQALLYINLQTLIDEAQEYYGDAYANETEKAALETAIEEAKLLEKTASKAEFEAAQEKLNAALTALKDNVAAYAELDALRRDVVEFMDQAGEDYDLEALDAYVQDGEGAVVEESLEDIIDGHLLTTEQIATYMAELNKLYEAAQKSGIKAGKDLPAALLADPSFENGGEGWQGKAVVSTAYQNCEKYEGTFDMYQEITGIPSGVYTVKAQAFQRVGYNDNASALFQSGQENITTYLYGNDIAKKVVSPYTEGMDAASAGSPADYEYNGTYIANSMQGFQAACEAGLYNNEVSVIVTDGTLRFGIRCAEGPGQGSGWWSIWDNFSVHYDGDLNSPDAIAKVTDQLTAEAAELAGKKMSADSLNALNAAVEALKANPGQETITAFNAAVAAAKTSIAAYEPLGTAIESTQQRYENVDVREAGVAAFEAAYETAKNAYNNGTAKDSEIESVIYSLKKAFTTYLISEDAPNATVNKPADLSYVLDNYDFSTMDQTGWSGTAGGFQASNGVEAIEFYSKNFDFYQEIPGMPAGRYELTVRGYYRQGNNGPMADSIAAGTLKEYAIAYINEAEAPLKSVSVLAMTSEQYAEAGITTGSDHATVTINGEELLVPNTMLTAQEVFQNEVLGPKTDITISYYSGNDVDLKIGAKKETLLSGDWTIIDGFTLKYLGNGSDGIENVNGNKANTTLGTQVYNVNGVATGKLQKGLNIVKTTLSDGTVKVTKVVVK